MAVVWIVTTGDSDVKLVSDTGWGDLRIKKLEQLHPCENDFAPKENIHNNLLTLSARVLGIVYGDALETHWQYLTFPLLDGFCRELDKDAQNNPDRIIMLLTDQDAILTDYHNADSPYWKDTCTLQPIFERYFQEKYNIKIEPKLLQPKESGLDDWNGTLTLVQQVFADLAINPEDRIIVSHQAGTPATSSAVQFASLSSFADRVSFLTSNERTKVVSLNPSSSYFDAMQIQQAKKFLNNYDYVSAFSILESKLEGLKVKNPDQADKILKLLEIAKLWNLSKFDEFKERMENLPIPSLRDVATARFRDGWDWWIAYEEAYLGIVRRRQGNVVEAFFHSFRAFEGILAEWSKGEFSAHISYKKDRYYLNASVIEDSKNYFANSKFKQDGTPNNTPAELQVELQKLANEGKVLDFAFICKLFRVVKPDYKSIGLDLVVHTEGISAKRNFIFHQVRGMQESQLMEFWKVDKAQERELQIRDWECKIRRFLNFIADEKDFKSWEEASLMARVHEELVKEIELIDSGKV